jgi:hypothetical protein
LTAPPGYLPYNTGPTPSGQLGRISGVAKAAMILTGLAGVLSPIAALIQASGRSRASDFVNGRIDAEEFATGSIPAQLLQGLQGLFAFAAAILSVIWMFKVAKNVRALGRQTTWAPLFSIFGWIMPPQLFVIPFLVLREMWKASDPLAAPGTESWKSGSNNPLLSAWFVLYSLIPGVIFALTFGSFINTITAGGDAESTAEQFLETDQYLIPSGILTLASAVVWVLFVKQLTARHVTLTGER